MILSTLFQRAWHTKKNMYMFKQGRTLFIETFEYFFFLLKFIETTNVFLVLIINLNY